MNRSIVAVAALYLAALCAPALAAEAPAPAEVVRIWPGNPPGTEDWTGPETEELMNVGGGQTLRTVSNVTTPTLTVYRPAAGTANGTGVIVIPGGGFQNLAISHEGELVAKWLAARGVTAFVLKYRVRKTPGFAIPADLRKHPERFAEFARQFAPGMPIAIADATQAMRYLRANAGRFGVATDRIGMMGFSAGAITTMGVILNSAPAERPNFAAPIYGAMVEDKPPPADGPPLFLAVTQDDNAVPAVETLKIFSRWNAAGLPAEVHVYERGGHGFGMRLPDTPVGTWTAAFETWLRMHGWLSKPR